MFDLGAYYVVFGSLWEWFAVAGILFAEFLLSFLVYFFFLVYIIINRYQKKYFATNLSRIFAVFYAGLGHLLQEVWIHGQRHFSATSGGVCVCFSSYRVRDSLRPWPSYCRPPHMLYTTGILEECNALLARYTQCIPQPSLALCKIMCVNR